MSCVMLASPAAAELSDNQQAAIDRLQPAMADQLGDAGAGTALAECVAETASNREARRIAQAETDQDAFDVANDIMTRPAVMACVTEKLTQ
ncbi:MAG: hypothetical protein AAF386_08600 [Pseudomonadota bacterium]